MIASQITNLVIVISTVNSGADQRKHQNSASLAFVRGFHRWPVNSLHKWAVTRKMFPFDDVIMLRVSRAIMKYHHMFVIQWECTCHKIGERVQRHRYDIWRHCRYTDIYALLERFEKRLMSKYRIMYVLAWRTVYALTRGLFWCLFPELRSNEGNKHQNNTRVSA